ncbi:MAG TPA: hypothetical protein VFV05_23670 [Methylomirabilota bacterium]|nr:hypothetical protein [Methylomirabilota bacterium]
MLIDRSHRPWILGSLVGLGVATAVYVPYARTALNGPSGGSWIGLAFGVVGFAFMLFAGLLGARRKVPTWRIGRGTAWMRAHIWLGLLSLPLIAFHGGFAFGGPLTAVLMVLFILVVLSGIVGVLLQQALPRLMLTRLPLETVYEQIDEVALQLLAESDGLVAAACGPLPVEPVVLPDARRAGGGAGAARPGQPRSSPRARPTALAPVPESAALRETYLRDIRPFLDPANRPDGVLGTTSRAATLFRQLRTTLPPVLQNTVSELEAVCDERRQLGDQKRLHHVLHGWLLVHVPLSYAVLLLGAAHAVIALRY